MIETMVKEYMESKYPKKSWRDYIDYKGINLIFLVIVFVICFDSGLDNILNLECRMAFLLKFSFLLLFSLLIEVIRYKILHWWDKRKRRKLNGN